jgi:hypothetical protein
MKKEFHLVLSFDTTDDDLMGAYQEIVVAKAREMFGAALLAHGALREGTPPPDIHLYSDDFLMGKEDIDLPKVVPAELGRASAAPASNKSSDYGAVGESEEQTS